MVEIQILGDRLALEVQGWHKLWALKSRLEIPLAHIKTVYADPKPAMGWFQGLKLAGADLPHIFRAGMFYQEGNLVFWDVRHPEKTLVLELEDEKFAKLIVEVDDPEAAIQTIQEALGQYRAHNTSARLELDHFLSEASEEPEQVRLHQDSEE
jgi:hypothetical protein